MLGAVLDVLRRGVFLPIASDRILACLRCASDGVSHCDHQRHRGQDHRTIKDDDDRWNELDVRGQIRDSEAGVAGLHRHEHLIS